LNAYCEEEEGGEVEGAVDDDSGFVFADIFLLASEVPAALGSFGDAARALSRLWFCTSRAGWTLRRRSGCGCEMLLLGIVFLKDSVDSNQKIRTNLGEEGRVVAFFLLSVGTKYGELYSLVKL